MKYLSFVALLLVCGCGPSPQPGKALVNTASTVTLTKLPDMPPPPSLEPTAATVAQAQAATQAAQANVRQAMSAQPPPAVIVPLSEADGQLTTAIGQQAAAVADLKEKHVAVAARDTERQNREMTYRTERDTLKEKSESDTKANQKLLDASAGQIAALEKEKQELQDEVNSRARLWLTVMGLGLILMGVVTIAARIKFGFVLGSFLGGVGLIGGMLCLTLAYYLVIIQKVMLAGLTVAVVSGLAWVLWKAVTHVPQPRAKP